MELHITRLETLWRCGEQYNRRYIKNEIIPPGIALVVGSSTHKSIEANLQNKIDKGELLSIDDCKDIANDTAKNLIKQGIKLSDEEMQAGLIATKTGAINMSISLAGLHRTDLAPSLNPISVEKSFKLKLKDTDYTINGRMDIEELHSIRDTKTAGKSDENAASKSLQLTMYDMAMKAQGKEITKLFIDQLVKTKVPKICTSETTRDEKDHEALLHRITSAIAQINAGIFPPCSADSWICSKRFCGYHDTCRYVRR